MIYKSTTQLVALAVLILTLCSTINSGQQFRDERLESLSETLFQARDEISEDYLSLENAENNAIGSYDRATFRRVCFYCIDEKLYPEDVDATLCNYILVCEAIPVNNDIVIVNEADFEVYPRIMGLKSINPELKVLIMLTGGNSTHGLPLTVLNEASRTEFINRVTSFLVTHKFDGLDVDWEFPTWHANNPNETHLFTVFLQELNSALKTVGNLTNGEPLLLSVDVAAPTTIVDVAYEPSEIAKTVDFINIMCYDYHFYLWYTPFTGYNGPLFARSSEIGYFATLNTAWTANYWVSLGVPKDKLNVGIPTYGHSFTLVNAEIHGVDALASGTGSFGGWPEYYQVCDVLKNNGTRVFDEEAKVPYAYRDTDWISYDDVESVTLKTQWISGQGFGGIMTFNLNCDDWRGSCDNQVKFPLHKAILSTLGINVTEMENTLTYHA